MTTFIAENLILFRFINYSKMKDPYKVTIGFGDSRGLTSLIILQESKHKI